MQFELQTYSQSLFNFVDSYRLIIYPFQSCFLLESNEELARMGSNKKLYTLFPIGFASKLIHLLNNPAQIV